MRTASLGPWDGVADALAPDGCAAADGSVPATARPAAITATAAATRRDRGRDWDWGWD
ncbi:hypothetical protein RB200_26895 [Streptomyces sp. PmtG]